MTITEKIEMASKIKVGKGEVIVVTEWDSDNNIKRLITKKYFSDDFCLYEVTDNKTATRIATAKDPAKFDEILRPRTK